MQCLKNSMQCIFQKSVHKKAVLALAERYTQMEDLRPEGGLEAEFIFIYCLCKNIK